MRKLRTSLISGAVLALAVTSLGAPVSAGHSGTIAIVNGIPGGKVDICLNGKEIRSGLRYGGRVFRSPVAGDKVLKVFKADPRTCKGKRLAKESFGLAVGADLTLVATKKGVDPVVIFDNDGLGLIPHKDSIYALYPNSSPIAWRHTADLGEVNFRLMEADPEQAVGPAVAAIWVKGMQLASEGQPAGSAHRLRVTPVAEKETTIARSGFVVLKVSRRYEWYLLGTKRKNAKIIVFSRKVASPII